MRSARLLFVIVLLAAGAVMTGPHPARALTAREAEKVVASLEQLMPTIDRIAFDEEEADIIFEEDSADQRLIEKAGFSQESWKAAFDATIKGFMATIPDAELDALFEKLRARVDAQASAFTAEQIQAVREMIDENLQEIQEYRQEGRQWAATVAPLAARLREIVPLEAGEE